MMDNEVKQRNQISQVKYIVLLLLPFFLNACMRSIDDTATNLKLWYDEPAKHFEESLVLGNGKHGATVYGGVSTDIIQLNDITLWSGEPVNPNMNPEAYKNIPAIREALENENYELADKLHRKLQGSFSQSYAPLGTIKIHANSDDDVDAYYRELDISNAVSMVNYEQDGIQYKKEYFVSHPDKILAIKLSSSQKGALSFDVDFGSLLKHKISTVNNVLIATGKAPIHAAPSYLGDLSDAVIDTENKGTRFATFIQLKNTDGELVSSDSTLGVKDASEVVVYVSMATSFNGFDKNPATEGVDYMKIAKEQLEQSLLKSYDELKADHIEDYQKFFNRVRFNLEGTDLSSMPTDDRLKLYGTGLEDKSLEVLYFQYGRYLLISSSRTPEVPANLQGLWNPHLRPPWSSNYTMNINAEENYWLAESTNLSEMHQPFLSFVNNLAITGEITAKTFYGTRGWAVAHNSDIWAMTNPVGNFGDGDPVWANWNMGGVWASTHLWEHYAFTKDIAFLKNKAYPLMKGAARFCLDWMIEDKDGFLITSPCTSPENKFVTNKGYHGATFYGGSADIAMIKELFSQLIKAAIALNINDEFIQEVKAANQKLLPYKIGEDGSLQEWYFDWKDEDSKHRHQTHLFGLYPGHHITPLKTPELADACRVALEIKGDETTGWSKGWRINLWARLRDGNRAYKMFRELLNYVEPDAIRSANSTGGGTYPNLFDAHPPFQIDGNFGGAAAVVEMLLQTNENEIHLLPALPVAWATGEIDGICARGGFVIGLNWKDGQLIDATITSKAGSTSTLIYKERIIELSLKKGESVNINF